MTGTRAAARSDNPTPCAADQAQAKNTLRISVPGFGAVALPPLEWLVYVAGVATLTALEIIEWPVAVAVVAGHVLADQRRSWILHDFGEALEEV